MTIPRPWFFRGEPRLSPDIDIAIVFEPEHGRGMYYALQNPDELHAADLASSGDEAVCFYLAICELIYTNHLLAFEHNNYATKLGLSVLVFPDSLSGPIARAAWDHDVDDVCLSITNGGLLS